MQQRDIIKDQIEQLGKVLAKVLSDFFDLKSTGNISNAITVTNESLKSELGLDINEIENLNHEDFEQYFTNKKLNDPSIEILADYLFTMAENITVSDKEKSINLYIQSLHLLEYLDKNSSIFYMERHDKKELIKGRL
jgi:hypothetical protein